VVDQLRREAGPALLINCGNLTQGNSKNDFEVNRRILKTALQGYEMMGAEIFAPGNQELIYGRQLILSLKESVPGGAIVCANLGGAPVPGIETHRLLEIDGRKILITALVDPDLEKKAVHGLFVTDPIPSLGKILKIPHDLALAVLHFSDSKARHLLREHSGLDLAILGTQRGTFAEAEKINDCWLLKNNNHGKTIGCLDWDFAARKPASHQIIKVNREDFAADQKVANLVADYEVWLRQHYIEKEQLQASHENQATIKVPYIGNLSCEPCHSEIVAAWSRSRHAQAYASLQKKCKDFCPDCLPCHVTGSRDHDKEGFISPAATPHLFNVQCEECHGPAEAHRQNPALPYGEKIELRTCTICHTPNTDPEFSFDDDINLVIH